MSTSASTAEVKQQRAWGKKIKVAQTLTRYPIGIYVARALEVN